jgi:hypothetical protein
MKLLAVVLITLLYRLADAIPTKTVPILDGEVTLEVPRNLSEKAMPSRPEVPYVYLITLQASDRELSVWATCSKHIMMRADLQSSLDEKLQWYSNATRLLQFRLLDHGLIQRQGREWAQIRFTHGTVSPANGEIYTRCLSGVIDGHLLEIWALAHVAKDPERRAAVDRVIDSVKITR